MSILRHDAIGFIAGQTIINRKLGNGIANIVVQARNHLNLTLDTMGKIFDIDIGKGRHDFLLCFMEGVVKLEITEKFVVSLASITNLNHPSEV
ncbi:Uncharacterised protein [Streptococcus pneumoniae]|nr:Uncharacterised protein [Streptococcus pneumoniae]